MDSRCRPKWAGLAFMLAQMGAHGAKQFAEKLAALSLTPLQARFLRGMGDASGLSQREAADKLGMHTSQLVAIVDEMESLGLVTREANAGDRRTYALHITPKGKEVLTKVVAVSRQHNEALFAALNDDERGTLADLLGRIAEEQGVTLVGRPASGQLSTARTELL
jgi:DNA-binding MarR family transcriptional regulator